MSACAGCGATLEPSRGTRARKWCSDRCRKLTLYAKRCVDCDAVINTDGSVTRASTRCNACNGAHTREMSRKHIVESMQEWARRYGAPPSAYDWNPWMVKAKGFAGSQWRITRYEEAGRRWPSATTVQNVFGTWNDGIRAAGFTPMDPSDYAIGRDGEALRDSGLAA